MPFEKVYGYRILCDQKKLWKEQNSGKERLISCQSACVVACENPEIWENYSEIHIRQTAIKAGFKYDDKSKTYTCGQCLGEQNQKKMQAQIPNSFN